MSFILFISLITIVPGSKLSLWQFLAVIMVSGMLHAYVYWIADIFLVKTGMLELSDTSFRKGKSPEEIVFQYAPISFFILGAAYAISALIAYEQLVCLQKGIFTFIWLMVAGLIFMATVTSFAYGLVDRLHVVRSKK